MDLLLHHEQGEETRRGTLSGEAQEDLKKHLKSSKQMIGVAALDISRLHCEGFLEQVKIESTCFQQFGGVIFRKQCLWHV